MMRKDYHGCALSVGNYKGGLKMHMVNIPAERATTDTPEPVFLSLEILGSRKANTGGDHILTQTTQNHPRYILEMAYVDSCRNRRVGKTQRRRALT
eukprot:4914514-Amphidinium_carterae.1